MIYIRHRERYSGHGNISCDGRTNLLEDEGRQKLLWEEGPERGRACISAFLLGQKVGWSI